jgi:hypothetical protein
LRFLWVDHQQSEEQCRVMYINMYVAFGAVLS